MSEPLNAWANIARGQVGPVEKGVPIHNKPVRQKTYGLQELTEVGMSRMYRIPKGETINAATVKVNYRAKSMGMKVAVRTVNRIKGVIRIWRIA